MVNFIICEDNLKFLNYVHSLITKFMMNSSIDYKINKYDNITQELRDYIYANEGINIYLLDMEIGSESGLDLAREIRRHDLKSVIIFFSSYGDLEVTIFKSKLMVLDFVCKFEDFENKFIESLQLACKYLNIKNIYRLESKNIITLIDIDTILYITKYGRKTVIVTTKGEYSSYKPIIEINNELNNCLFKTHKSCYVMVSNIERIDHAANIITFKNGMTLDLLSNKYKGDLKLHV